MPLPPPAALGSALGDVDTPALIVDLDAFERNLARMAEFARAAGVRLRPHAKTHKSPIIAARQIALGAVGVCCQKVAEAEVMVAGGIRDVLLSNEIAGRGKLDRLAALAALASLAVCADDQQGVAELAAAADRAGTRLGVLVEIDVGGQRCGVAPGEPAAALALAIARSPHLRFAGLQAYYGSAQHLREAAARAAAIGRAGAAVAASERALRAVGLSAAAVTGAGTGTFEHEAASGLWNELQPGSYIFMDADYARNQRADGQPFDRFEHALFVYATVMSAPVPERLVVDAGHKALSVDSGMPLPWGLPGARYHRPSDEHGIIDVSEAAARPVRGQKLLLVPGHCDPTVNLHDWYVGIRGLGTGGARVECLWPVAARGALF